MQKQKISIFRKSALDHYIQSREQVVLPRLITPLVFKVLWLLLVALCGVGVIAMQVNIPRFVPAKAIILEDETYGEIVLLALAPDDAAHLYIGQKLNLPDSHKATVADIDITLQAGQVIQAKYGLSETVLADPSAIVIATLDNDSPKSIGSTYSTHVEAGSRRVGSLFPIFKEVFNS